MLNVRDGLRKGALAAVQDATLIKTYPTKKRINFGTQLHTDHENQPKTYEAKRKINIETMFPY